MNKIIEQIEKIKQINSNENLVIFVGAGVSKNSGVCSWWELVKEIADKIGENKCTSCEIKDLLCGECGEQIEMCSINGYNCKLKYDFSAEDFLRIPQHFYESFGDTEEEKKTYYDFLKEKFCSDEYETNIIDEIIVKLQPEHIITTNYDHLLENVNDPRVSKYAIITKDNDILSKKGRNYIIKMHGDIDDIQNIVLKEDDYLNYSQNHIIIETFIKSLLIDKTFLFVGYSLNDNNLKLIMSYIDFFVKEKRVENRQPHYLVVDKIKDCAHDISYWKNKGVELVDLSQISDYMIDNSNCENISNDIGKKLYAFLYYLNNEGLAYKTFIIKLNEQWTDFFSYIAVNKILPLKQIRGFSLDSLCLLDENKIQDINVEGCLTDYISNQSDYLNIQNPDVAKIISQFCILGVKLKKIEIDTANKDLIVGVYENNLYELTFENIKLMIKSMYGEYDSYNIEHRNYTVIQGKSESPLAKYIAENINRYANEYLKNCNGYIEDSEDVAIKFINDENVLGDIQEKYVNVLKTVISDISVIQNKKLWNEMLDKRIIKKTVPNIIHYYTEYCCDSQLIKFINECDAGMDYSHIENEFGGEIAREFFDSVAVNNEIKTSRYQEILCNMGYGYDVYDAYDISDDKMEVLIKKDVIEMNNVGLEYIRNHYKKYTALYIDENIEAYLRIITSDNFSYEEALHILGMEIGDEEKIDLLGLTTEPISVVGKGYSSSLIKYILDNNFDKHDENELYQHFSEYEEVIQSSIYRVAESRIANIIDNSTIVLDDNLLSQLLTMSKCSMDDKIQLWAKALPNLTEETCKKHFEELGFPELKGIFTKRNNYTKTYEDNSFIRDILYVLKKNTWIFDYYKKSDDEGYVVVKNPIKDKRY